jgi:UDP-N-acetylglucosamine 2-epimerase (non-hydrolysing)
MPSSKQFKVFNIVGARPNMMKMAPIMAEMRKHTDLSAALIHTGQHYDFAMSQVFLQQLGLGEPDFNLHVGSSSHHTQTAEVMKRFGEIVQAERPNMIVVAGDVNSTMACAIVGAKEAIPVAHVEAGLRSFDRTMPEEVNRILTDSVSDLLFVTEKSGSENLQKEGVNRKQIHFVGNVMIDSLVLALDSARKSHLLSELGLAAQDYLVLTLHRPSNVDDPERLRQTLEAIAKIATKIPVIFPIHPRTATRAAALAISGMKTWQQSAEQINGAGIWTIPPASYIDFLGLVQGSSGVITDSGGIQEETTYLGIPCLTFRNNTERPVTVEIGTNRLIGANPDNLLDEAEKMLINTSRQPLADYVPPPLWDGHASERIVNVIREFLTTRG